MDGRMDHRLIGAEEVQDWEAEILLDDGWDHVHQMPDPGNPKAGEHIQDA
jgi:hypothetical protein